MAGYQITVVLLSYIKYVHIENMIHTYITKTVKSTINPWEVLFSFCKIKYHKRNLLRGLCVHSQPLGALAAKGHSCPSCPFASRWENFCGIIFQNASWDQAETRLQLKPHLCFISPTPYPVSFMSLQVSLETYLQ